MRARPDLDVVAEGDAQLRQGPLEIRADRLTYEQATDTARATGNVRISQGGNLYSGPELQLQLGTYQGYFVSPTYFFSRLQAGGTATRLDFMGNDVAIATGGNYTSCPREGGEEPAWLLSTDRVRMDLPNNEGIAEGAVLRFYGVPILAAPVLSFPLTDARKSGWLPPTTSVDNKSGLQLSVPYYWNIAPNRDATFTPMVLAKRGVGLGTEFRYLEPSDEGMLEASVLPHDRLAGRSRHSAAYAHEGNFFPTGYYKADVVRVSDNAYWKDFPGDYSSLTPRLLIGDAQVHAPVFGNWKTYARVLRWQLLQDARPDAEMKAPYNRYPQVGLRGTQLLPGGIEFGMEAEYNRFTNPNDLITEDSTRVTGERWHTIGSLGWPMVTPGWSLVPKFSFNAASYRLDRPLTEGAFAGQRQLSRSIPTFSLDSAWVLERHAMWFGRAMQQTLEPRLYYLKTPYRDQNGLPQFDSAGRDFNFDSIYSDNAFSGVDRVSDAHQLTAGVSTRMFDAQTGAEALRLGLAQRFLFSDQLITPDGPPDRQHVSDLLLMGSTSFWPQWKIDAGVQYSPEISRTRRSMLSARYSPGPYRTLYTAYRFKRDESEQVELGWQWPIYGRVREGKQPVRQECSGAWYSVGRVSYSMRESRVTDSVLGFEYDAGCWIGRVIAKRLSTSRQDATTQLGFEIEFVGLSRLGTNPLKVLKDNIPGYRMLRDDPSTVGPQPVAVP